MYSKFIMNALKYILYQLPGQICFWQFNNVMKDSKYNTCYPVCVLFTLTTHMLFAKPQRVSQLALPKKKKKKMNK